MIEIQLPLPYLWAIYDGSPWVTHHLRACLYYLYLSSFMTQYSNQKRRCHLALTAACGRCNHLCTASETEKRHSSTWVAKAAKIDRSSNQTWHSKILCRNWHSNSNFQPTLCSASSECLAACRKWLFERSAASWAGGGGDRSLMENDVMSILLSTRSK